MLTALCRNGAVCWQGVLGVGHAFKWGDIIGAGKLFDETELSPEFNTTLDVA